MPVESSGPRSVASVMVNLAEGFCKAQDSWTFHRVPVPGAGRGACGLCRQVPCGSTAQLVWVGHFVER